MAIQRVGQLEDLATDIACKAAAALLEFWSSRFCGLGPLDPSGIYDFYTDEDAIVKVPLTCAFFATD